MDYKTTLSSEKNIRNYVKGYMIPKIKIIIDNIKKRMQTVVNKELHLRKGIVADVKFGDDTTDTIVSTTVPGDQHTHTADEVSTSTIAIPNGIVKRNSKGEITGASSVYGNTGYKLANGSDISTLFRNKAVTPVTVENKTIGSGAFVTDVSLTMTYSGEDCKLTVNKTMGALCPSYRYPDITVDGCH